MASLMEKYRVILEEYPQNILGNFTGNVIIELFVEIPAQIFRASRICTNYLDKDRLIGECFVEIGNRIKQKEK